MKKLKALKGTVDILPVDSPLWQRIERVVIDTMRLYGYDEIRTPIFEETSLFARSIGEDTDIVGKEMYTFNDMGNRSLTLRPEGTASIIRAFIEHSLDQSGLPAKLWYMGPMFRQERPQKGRQRQFHQFGAEVVGSPLPAIDAEVMILFDDITSKLGIDERRYKINSLGGAESRNAYRKALESFLGTVEDSLCEDCLRRKKTNPLRVLDCKVPSCVQAVQKSESLPQTLDYLTDEDSVHFDAVCTFLDIADISFEIEPSLVRGLDYYTGVVFEMHSSSLGAQSAIMGGGRYDRLVEELGGKEQPSVGFACGMERLILAMEAAGSASENTSSDGVYIVCPEDGQRKRAVSYLSEVRALGIRGDMDYMDRSMRAQMKAAARFGAKWTVIIEPEGDSVSVRDMDASEQETMTFSSFLDKLQAVDEVNY